MTDREQTDAFQADLERLISRYKSEFNLSVGAAIGVLEVVKLDLWWEQKPGQEDDDDEETPEFPTPTI